MTIAHARWLAKKAARGAVVLGSVGSGSLARARRNARPSVRAITYHRFGHARRDPWCIDPDVFERQMCWLAEHRLGVSLDDALRFARGELRLASGSLLVTIDDGFRSVLSVAAPILRRYAIPAVAFVTTKVVDDPTAGEGTGERFLNWEEVAELGASGVTIGSHSHTHRSMARLDPAEARDEARRSKELLEAHLGREVTSFAYPFGMRRDESPQTAMILAECGYRSVFISQHGAILPGADPLRLPRVKVEAGDPFWLFRHLCRGSMDAWSLAERLL
jgi:peptidoglycan/xylan/chitin deacetylase (PgdA/CDA1 family)